MPDTPTPTDPAATTTNLARPRSWMPVRVPPADVARMLDQTTATTMTTGLAAALLGAVRDIHTACAEHRSHGNRSVPVVDLDIILGRRLRPHLRPAADPATPTEPPTGEPPISTDPTT